MAELRPSRLVSNGTSRAWPLQKAPGKVYVAASLAEQKLAAQVALTLMRETGAVPTSRWLELMDQPRFLDGGGAQIDGRSYQARREFAEWQVLNCDRDVEDLFAADMLVMLADRESTTGGMWTELGLWIGSGRKDVVLVCKERDNVFAWHEEVRWFKQLEDFWRWTRTWPKR